MRAWLLLTAAFVLLPLGCGGGPTGPAEAPRVAQETPAKVGNALPALPPPPQAPPAGGQDRANGPRQQPVADQPAAGEKQPAHGEVSSRKIVYNGNVQMIVTDLDKKEAELKAIIKDCDAFIASSELTGQAGSPRAGHWRVRVPVKTFDEFMDAVVKLGVPQKNTTESQDVTDDYYDLEDRIKNKRMELETLRGYLQEKKTTSQLETILKIEAELSRVRGELDQLEGKLRRMKDLTALATVNVTMQEVKDYQPAPPPGFANSVQTTFADSLDLLGRFGKGVAIVFVALAPWLAVVAVVAVPGWRIGRRCWKKAREVTP